MKSTAGSAQRFNSRENSSNPPQLTVTYQVPCVTPTPTPANANPDTDGNTDTNTDGNADTNTDTDQHIWHYLLLLESSPWPSAKCDAHPDR